MIKIRKAHLLKGDSVSNLIKISIMYIAKDAIRLEAGVDYIFLANKNIEMKFHNFTTIIYLICNILQDGVEKTMERPRWDF